MRSDLLSATLLQEEWRLSVAGGVRGFLEGGDSICIEGGMGAGGLSYRICNFCLAFPALS